MLMHIAFNVFNAQQGLRFCFINSPSAGGETIKQINQQTGAHCELDRRPPPNPAEKVFVIRGSPDQIEQAKRIISEKIGMVCNKHFILVKIICILSK